MKTKVYTGITKELIDKASTLKEAKEFDLDLNSTSGVVKKWGVKIKYSYNPLAKTSTLTIQKKPFIVTYEFIWNKLDKAFDKIKNL